MHVRASATYIMRYVNYSPVSDELQSLVLIWMGSQGSCIVLLNMLGHAQFNEEGEQRVPLYWHGG